MASDATSTDPDAPEHCEAVILGAGLSGMTAAYRLRGREIVVLETEDRVGGRTLSGGDDHAWYNLGAQIVGSARVADLCRELGLDLVSLRHADYGLVVNGKFSRGSTPEVLLTRLNLSLAQRLDYGISSLRLRRKLHAIPKQDPSEREELDRKSLLDVIGRVAPSTMQLHNACCVNSAGFPLDSTSAFIGLVYALGAYLDPRTKEDIYGVRGGTQQVTRAIAARLGDGALRLGCDVRSVESQGDSVRVTYGTADGRESVIVADHCVSALPAHAVLRAVEGLTGAKRTALRRLTPYSTLISVSWPVADNRPAPWDGVFFTPVSGSERLGLITNYGYLAKQDRPELGGYLNTFVSGATADAYQEMADDELLDMHHAELLKVFPTAGSLLDRRGARLHRWTNVGLPAMRPGYLTDRRVIREPVGRIVFCGDYTSEPGLNGAYGSGNAAGKAVLEQLPALQPSLH
jgi:oxygen-dependent protoporphyrinogen oxidase